MPKAPISGLFGSSPFKPLQEHMASVQECTARLLPYFDAVLNKDWDEAARQQQKISELEKHADRLKRHLRELLTMQDKVANKAKDIAGLILGRKMEFPESIGPQLREFVTRSIDASAQAQTAINELDELVETGFRGNEVKLVASMIHQLDEIEHDTDRMQVHIRTGLAAVEKELPPVDVMFLYKIIDWIGDLGDRAQQVGSRLELLLAK
jgi:uncharacterized protein Yka (UPF0111/DUF47 family)